MRKLISRIFGAIADTKFPKFIQIFINEKYVNFFKIDMSEFENVRSFPTLNALFTRKLIKPRQIPSQKDALICPVDSEILSFGKAQRAIGETYFRDLCFCLRAQGRIMPV